MLVPRFRPNIDTLNAQWQTAIWNGYIELNGDLSRCTERGRVRASQILRDEGVSDPEDWIRQWEEGGHDSSAVLISLAAYGFIWVSGMEDVIAFPGEE